MQVIDHTEQSVFQSYESSLKNYRTTFADYLTSFFDEFDERVLLQFWINFSYLGVGMTEPVEHWIRKSGENCKKLGFDELGIKLCKHAIHEADHHHMMIEDTKKLVARWNKKYMPTLNAEELLARPIQDCVKKYQDLHEFYINGDSPFCQIAIEYEIENLSATYGAQIMNHTNSVLGKEIEDSITFLEEHIRIDVAHTLYNRKAISDFLSAYPDAQKKLVEAGSRALDIYGNFLKECHALAKLSQKMNNH